MKRILIIIATLSSYSLFAQTTVAQYTDFLNQEHLSPKAYILQLFEQNDIIILGERDHRDTTQYDLILDIIGDNWFIENVAHVYTEVGVTNNTEWANQVLKANYKTDNDFETAVIKLYRELDFNSLWEKYNMYKYLKGIYTINKGLAPNKKITVGLTDQAFSWQNMTKEKLEKFHKILSSTYRYRDSIMAANFINLYEKQMPINGTKKALLIQSRPHAINMDVTYKGRKIKNTGSYIVDKYENKTKIIAFNWYHWMPLEWYKWMPEKSIKLTDDGKWNAAFELTSHNPVGFDLKNTPFGLTEFDYSYEQGIKYQDVIDGIIYYKPFYEFVCTVGVPNVVDDAFAVELIRRGKLVNGEDFSDSETLLMDYYNDVRSFECEDYKMLKEQMNKWLKQKKGKHFSN